MGCGVDNWRLPDGCRRGALPRPLLWPNMSVLGPSSRSLRTLGELGVRFRLSSSQFDRLTNTRR
jgi:hypothetical protein